MFVLLLSAVYEGELSGKSTVSEKGRGHDKSVYGLHVSAPSKELRIGSTDFTDRDREIMLNA